MICIKWKKKKKIFSTEKKKQQISFTNSQQLLNTVSPLLKVSCWQMINISPLPHPAVLAPCVSACLRLCKRTWRARVHQWQRHPQPVLQPVVTNQRPYSAWLSDQSVWEPKNKPKCWVNPSWIGYYLLTWLSNWFSIWFFYVDFCVLSTFFFFLNLLWAFWNIELVILKKAVNSLYTADAQRYLTESTTTNSSYWSHYACKMKKKS